MSRKKLQGRIFEKLFIALKDGFFLSECPKFLFLGYALMIFGNLNLCGLIFGTQPSAVVNVVFLHKLGLKPFF